MTNQLIDKIIDNKNVWLQLRHPASTLTFQSSLKLKPSAFYLLYTYKHWENNNWLFTTKHLLTSVEIQFLQTLRCNLSAHISWYCWG